MVERPRLFVLPPSHYCERARWALDHVALDYQEERLAVGLHILRARSMAQATTLPILASGRAIIQGSGAILDFVGVTGGGYELERRFDDRIGVLVRQFRGCSLAAPLFQVSALAAETRKGDQVPAPTRSLPLETRPRDVEGSIRGQAKPLVFDLC